MNKNVDFEYFFEIKIDKLLKSFVPNEDLITFLKFNAKSFIWWIAVVTIIVSQY